MHRYAQACTIMHNMLYYRFILNLWVLFCIKTCLIFATSTGEKDVVRPDDKNNFQLFNL